MPDAPVRLSAPPQAAGQRLDHWLQTQLPETSRSRLQQWIKQERVLVDGQAQRPSYALRGGEAVEVTPAAPPPLAATPEDLPVQVLYEDAAVLAVDKPAGMVVHAGAGVHEGTLVNALLHHFGTLSAVQGDLRPGIVHRIDKETSGVLLVAKTDAAHLHLAQQFAGRTVEKSYRALVHGHPEQNRGSVQTPIARDPVRRIRMTTRLKEGRAAHTDWQVLGRSGDKQERTAYLDVAIHTGRTHQIRVHLSSLGHPIVGDQLYGAPQRFGPLPWLERFLLHAHRIGFLSPATGERVTVEAPLPSDFQRALTALGLSGL